MPICAVPVYFSTRITSLSRVFLFIALFSAPLHAQTAATAAEATRFMRNGLASAQRGDLSSARRDFERVVKLEPTVAPGHSALGWVLLSQGDLTRAEAELKTALRLAPGDVLTQLNLARCESGLGQHQNALELFRKAASHPNSPTLNDTETIAFAYSLNATGDTQAALDLLTHAANANPQSAALQDAVGSLLASDGRATDAIPWFDRSLAADRNYGPAQYHRAAALLDAGQASEALQIARSLLARSASQNFDLELLLGRALSATHNDGEALAHLHRATQLDPKDHPPQAQYALALALQASGDPAASLLLFAGVVDGTAKLPLEDNSPLINYALARVQTGDADGALTLYARALAHGPDSATLREDYGAAFLQTAHVDEAIHQFRAGLILNPNSALLHYDLGLALKLQDDLTGAVTEFERAATLDPQLPDPAYTLGVIYMQQGKFSEAADSLRRAIALQPGNGDAWALLGSVLKDSDHPDEAASALEHAIAIEPDQPSLHIQLAAIEVSQGKRERAAAERKIAADLSRAATDRQRAGFALRSGRALLAQGKLAEAVTQLNNAIRAEPGLPEPHVLLAEAYTRQGRIAAAALERQQAAKLEHQPMP